MQNLEQVFREEMRKSALRVTENRLAIFRVLAHAKKPLSIQEIVELTASDNYFTSVYRSIEAMTRARILRAVPRGFKNLYELGEAFRPHHHHATCEKCGRSVGIHDADLEKIMHELTTRAGLSPTKHHFELFGVCGKCQQKRG